MAIGAGIGAALDDVKQYEKDPSVSSSSSADSSEEDEDRTVGVAPGD